MSCLRVLTYANGMKEKPWAHCKCVNPTGYSVGVWQIGSVGTITLVRLDISDGSLVNRCKCLRLRLGGYGSLNMGS